MLNVKALTALLSHNRDDRLCKQWYVMTPNGTLLAHSQPANINELRKHAAVAAMTWQEHEHGHDEQRDGHFDGEMGEDKPTAAASLHMLIVESEASNTLMRKLQNQVLLVLEGGVPPRRATFAKGITAERADGRQQTWPQAHANDRNGPLTCTHANDSAGQSTHANDSDGQCTPAMANKASHGAIAANVRELQRHKVEALAAAIISDFRNVGFEMPVEGSTTVF